MMSDGKGELNREYLLEQLPDDLVIDKDQVLDFVTKALEEFFAVKFILQFPTANVKYFIKQ